MSPESIPTVVIVGRPNVGKSTLFNRLIGKRRAITLDEPGVTRDPIRERVAWNGRAICLVDTGGLGGEAVIELAARVHEHTVRSVRNADLVVAVLDAKSGLTPLDRETVDLLKRVGVPVLYVANKADGARAAAALVEFCSLGIDVPLGVSAEHGVGIHELRSAILQHLPARGSEEARESETESEAATTRGAKRARRVALEETADDESTPAAQQDLRPCRVAIVGRPNVGKSSFLNAVAGRELSLVDPTPGTTRDIVDTEIERRGKRYLLIDTAGMRRRSRVIEDVERISVSRSVQAVERADVVVLLIEPNEAMTDQDARIARIAWDEGRALVIAMNKADLLDREASRERIRRDLRERYPTLIVQPLIFLSVTRKQGLDDVFDAIDRADEAHRREIRTVELNQFLADATERKETPTLAGGRVRFYYMTQTAIRPPTFTIFANRERIPVDYTRFLERCLREAVPLEGTPVRIRLRRRASHGVREQG